MERYEFTFRVEMTINRTIREVPADSYHDDGKWVRFFRRGALYWMANQNHVVSMESRRNDPAS